MIRCSLKIVLSFIVANISTLIVMKTGMDRTLKAGHMYMHTKISQKQLSDCQMLNRLFLQHAIKQYFLHSLFLI